MGHQPSSANSRGSARYCAYDALMPDDTPTELARLLVEVGWSQRELARRLNVTELTRRSWASGRRECHFTVLEWLLGIRDRMHAGRNIRTGGKTPPLAADPFPV
jgi:hypothetical protein